MKDYTNGHIADYQSLTLHFDGGCEPKNPGGTATCGWVFYDKAGNLLAEEGRIAISGPKATNNYAEYCALGFALRFLIDADWKGVDITIKADSSLIIDQVTEKCQCKAENLIPLRRKIWEYLSKLGLEIISDKRPITYGGKPCYFIWIPREQNGYANDLCRKAYQEHIKPITKIGMSREEEEERAEKALIALLEMEKQGRVTMREIANAHDVYRLYKTIMDHSPGGCFPPTLLEDAVNK